MYRWEHALGVLERVPEPDVVSFSSAISALEKAGRWEGAANCGNPLHFDICEGRRARQVWYQKNV